jgi:acetate kinase
VRVLVLNAGSSTLKWTLLEGRDRTTIQSGEQEWSARDGRAQQVRATLREVSAFDAVGHRVVHGGTRFCHAVVIDREVRLALESLIDIDPLHMPAALAGVDAVSGEFPAVTQVAAFDTSFHAAMPEAAAGYGLPYEWSERWGLRRFGFHGLSIGYALARTRALLGLTPRRLIVCHLGSGCSVTALAQGQSVDTTMGFSPLEGVMMATRCGSVDPGLLLHLQSRQGIGVQELLDALENRSGLLGVSGVSADLRRVLEAAAAGAPRARLAYDRFVLSLRRAVGSMAGVLGGVDTLVFTGGIGENSAQVRVDVAATLEFTGLRLSSAADQASVPDRVISASGSAVAVLVVHAREDLMVLDEVLRLADVTSVPG